MTRGEFRLAAVLESVRLTDDGMLLTSSGATAFTIARNPNALTATPPADALDIARRLDQIEQRVQAIEMRLK